jgi:hypothetical protein
MHEIKKRVEKIKEEVGDGNSLEMGDYLKKLPPYKDFIPNTSEEDVIKKVKVFLGEKLCQ